MQFDLFPQKIYVVEKSCMPLTSIRHAYVSHKIDGATFPAFSLWKAAGCVAQLTHRLNLPRSPLLGYAVMIIERVVVGMVRGSTLPTRWRWRQFNATRRRSSIRLTSPTIPQRYGRTFTLFTNFPGRGIHCKQTYRCHLTTKGGLSSKYEEFLGV